MLQFLLHLPGWFFFFKNMCSHEMTASPVTFKSGVSDEPGALVCKKKWLASRNHQNEIEAIV